LRHISAKTSPALETANHCEILRRTQLHWPSFRSMAGDVRAGVLVL